MTDALHAEPLIVFAKWPAPGQVKTRLCPPLTRDQAARLYRGFLDDLLRRLARQPRAVVVAVHPADAVARFRAFVPAAFAIMPQVGPGLGERMAHAFATALARAPHAVLIGSDIPHLPLTILDTAFAVLARGASDVVFCPDDAGGYCLVGMRAPVQQKVFLDLPMSVAANYQRTLDRCAELGLKVHALEPCFDVDNGEDLERLAQLLVADAQLRLELPETLRCLKDMRWL